MQRTSKITSVVVALTLVTGGIAMGSPTASKSIYACLSASAGTLSKVSIKAPKCPKGTTLISWNQAGAQGTKGVQGAQGIQGVQGVPGPQGVQGIQGEGNAIFATSGDQKFRVFRDFQDQTFVEISGSWWLVCGFRKGEGRCIESDNPYPETWKIWATVPASLPDLTDFLVFDQNNCQGQLGGQIEYWRMGGPGFGPNVRLVENLAVKIAGKHYKATTSEVLLSEVKSFFNGASCVEGSPPPHERFILVDLTEITEPPSLVFDPVLSFG